MFVCLFAVNTNTTERIDSKRSGITKNYPKSVLCGLKSPVLVFLGRYGYISGFSFAADRHFYLSSFHFRLLLRRLHRALRKHSKTMARIDAKRSGITTNIPESVLHGLKSPALGFSWRYRDSSGFPFSADSHFYFSPFHFWLLLRRLYNTDWNIV